MGSLIRRLVTTVAVATTLGGCGVKSGEWSGGAGQNQPQGEDQASAPAMPSESAGATAGKDLPTPVSDPKPGKIDSSSDDKTQAAGSRGTPTGQDPQGTSSNSTNAPSSEGGMPPIYTTTISSDDTALTPLVVLGSSGGDRAGLPTIGASLPPIAEPAPSASEPSASEPSPTAELLYPAYDFTSPESSETLGEGLNYQCFMFKRFDPATSLPSDTTVSICKIDSIVDLALLSDLSWSFSLANCPEGTLIGSRTWNANTQSFSAPGTMISIPIEKIDACVDRKATLTLKITRKSTGVSTQFVRTLKKTMLPRTSFNSSYSLPLVPVEPMIAP